MRVLTVDVERCLYCPYRHLDEMDEAVCEHSGRGDQYIVGDEGAGWFPEWCPLTEETNANS